MESNQSLSLKKGVWVSLFEAHSNEHICNPVCSAPDLSVFGVPVTMTQLFTKEAQKGLWKWLQHKFSLSVVLNEHMYVYV